MLLDFNSVCRKRRVFFCLLLMFCNDHIETGLNALRKFVGNYIPVVFVVFNICCPMKYIKSNEHYSLCLLTRFQFGN